MSVEYIETLIVGAGQAGLAMSHMLRRRGCPHLVLERGRIVERWRSERWDGLRFQFPNWSVELPDFPFHHHDPDGFATVSEIVDYLTAYAEFVAPPIRCGVEVKRLRYRDGKAGFMAETSHGPVEAANVVVATGPYQRPVIPSLQIGEGIFQVHASRYRGPGQLPPGSVLIIGSGASGAQIAEELHRAGRRVYLSVGRHRRVPRRYRGRDFMWWVAAMGLFDAPVEKRPTDRAMPLITGAYGGHTIDFRQYAAQGMTLLGRVKAAEHGILTVAPDLADSLAYGDAAYHGFLDAADSYVENNDLDLPADPQARVREPDPTCVLEPLRRLDLHAAKIGTVIWSTGYSTDFIWIDVPVLDAAGEPLHSLGVAAVPGIYFIGLQWLSKMKSSALAGVGEDASRLADHIAAHR